MSTRARFYIRSVELLADKTSVAQLSVVSRGPENSHWAKFTPSGNLSMTLSRDASGAKDFFTENIGREVFLDITLADEPTCTQCGGDIVPPGQLTAENQAKAGVGVHAGSDGYVPGEFVHSGCLAEAKERLGIG